MSRTTKDPKTNHFGIVVNDKTLDFLEFRAKRDRKSKSEIARTFIDNALRKDQKFNTWHKINSEISGS